MINYDLDEIYARKIGHGSLGMTSKYFKDNYWYKQNLKGYEGLSEEICSTILKHSNIKDYVTYEQCSINGVPGCRSLNFTSEHETVVTFQRLYYFTYGGNLKNKINSYSTLADRINYVLDYINEFTGLDCYEYLSDTLYFDMLTLNVDRHFGNLALIRSDCGWRLAPMFDFGASFFSLQHVFRPDMSIDEKYSIMTPQPFGSFKEQAGYFGKTNIKINYSELTKALSNIEGMTDELMTLVTRQLDSNRDIFKELKPVNKSLISLMHKNAR